MTFNKLYLSIGASASLLSGLFSASAFAQDIPLENRVQNPEVNEGIAGVNSSTYLPPFRIELNKSTFFVSEKSRNAGNIRFVINRQGEPVGHLNIDDESFILGDEEFYLKLPEDGENLAPILTGDPEDWDWDEDWDEAPLLGGAEEEERKIPEEEWSGRIIRNDIRIPIDTRGPGLRVFNKEFFEKNSFLAERIPFKVETNEKYVSYKIIDGLSTTERLTKSTNTKLELKWTPYFKEGNNQLSISAKDYLGNSTTIIVNVKREGITKNVDGINFTMPGIVHKNFERDREIYVSLAKEINAHNLRCSSVNYLRDVFILYYSLNHRSRAKPPTDNGWYHYPVSRLTLGYGNFIVDNSAREVNEVCLHEVGHKIEFNLETINRADFNNLKIIFQEEHNRAGQGGRNGLFWRVFTDSVYGDDLDAGHPWNKKTELFASSYMIFRLYNQRLKRRIARLPLPQRKNANKLYNILMNLKENSDLRDQLSEYPLTKDELPEIDPDIFNGFH